MAVLRGKPAAKRSKRRQFRPGMAELRVRELGRLLNARFGYVLPDTDAGRSYAVVMVQHLARLQGVDVFQRVPAWCSLYAPFMGQRDVLALLNECIGTPKYWKATALGWHLRLTSLERSVWRITTIAAFDRDISTEKSTKHARKIANQTKRRRKAGAKPRAEYIAGIKKDAKPWVQLGVSRATYFRQKAKALQN